MAGSKVPGGGGRESYTLHRHHHNDSCIKVGSDESHFNVSLTVRDKVARQCPQTTTFEEKGQPKQNRSPSAYQPNALPLGQTVHGLRIHFGGLGVGVWGGDYEPMHLFECQVLGTVGDLGLFLCPSLYL